MICAMSPDLNGMEMHPELSPQSTVLRKGSYRILGPAFLVLAAFSGFMISRSDTALATRLVPVIFGAAGLWFLLTDTRFLLFRERDRLCWTDRCGRNSVVDGVDIPSIARLDVYRMRPANTRGPAHRLRLELVTTDEHCYELPSNLGFGGPGNPRYDDLIRELHQVRPEIEVRVIEHEGWRKPAMQSEPPEDPAQAA